MPSYSPVNSSESGCILIVAPSGRALARAARDSGYTPLVADFFDDLDTRDLAAANRLVEGDADAGFEAKALMSALHALCEGHQPIGLVYGAGFEDRIDLLDRLGQHWPLLGNAPSVLAHVKDPLALAALCSELAIMHPETRIEPPLDTTGWLIKHAGGCGGAHVAPAEPAPRSESDYYQRCVAGRPVSALLLADGRRASVLGFSEQWASAAPGQLWRFGGSARPARLDSALAKRLTQAAQQAAEAAHLAGLNSVDFLVDDAGFHLIEINPRPGATLDIFHDADGRLLRAHVEACHGHLPDAPLRFAAAEAASFVYAPASIASVPLFSWPDWTADRQKPASQVAKYDPLCTVLASGADFDRVADLIRERVAYMQTLLSPAGSKFHTDPNKDAAA